MFVETSYDSTVRCDVGKLQPTKIRELYGKTPRFCVLPHFLEAVHPVVGLKKPVRQEYIKVRKQPGARRAAYPEPLGGLRISTP